MSTIPIRACVALGTNLGDRSARIAHALRALRATRGIGQVVCSSIYETDPVGPPQPNYLNAVVSLTTTLDAPALLKRLQAIEAEAGRERSAERNGPRTLDLDLLLHGDTCIDEPGLQVPHPRMHERAFVLVPLCDVAPRVRHPVLDACADELLAGVRDREGVRLYRSNEPGRA